jgi:predicted small lipoprotein YifL
MTSGPHKPLRFVGAASAAIRPPLRILRAATLAALLLGAVSCGQTGPLTLPERAPPASTGAAPPAEADAAEEDQTERDER